MILPCTIAKLSTLKNGGKAVFRFTDDVYDTVSEYYGNFRDKPLQMTMANSDGEAVKVPCNIDNMESLTKGGKLIVAFGDDVIDQVTKEYRKFRGVPLNLELQIDADKQREILSQISGEQRKMCFAIFKDIGVHTGDYNVESVKEQQKANFLRTFSHHEAFSLSNCKRELANEFITFLVTFCFIQGIPLRQSPREAFSEVEVYLYLCLKHKKCCITGKPGEVHHVSSIGMGRDRRHYDDSKHLKICLSREMHTEAHTIGWDTFAEKYHVIGVIFNG
jgi:hypothetical protein